MKTLLLALTGLCLSGTAFAQSADVLQVKTRVRLTAPTIEQDRLVGRIEGRDSATVLLLRDSYQVPVTVPLSAIHVAERSLGHHRGRWAAAGLGLGIAGGVLGGLVVAGTNRDGALAPVGGAFLGMIVGPIIGAAAAPERWQAVPVPGRR